MRRSFVALATVFLTCAISGASEKPPVVQDVIHATQEKIKKAARSMFVPEGFTIDSETLSQLEVSRPVSSEEMARYNTENWTNQSVSNCRRMLTLIMSPENQATNVTIRLGTVCHTNGYGAFFKMWGTLSREKEKDVQWMNSILANLKGKADQRD
jgi:hypothetical protein